MLADLSRDLGLGGAMIPGGTISYQAWIEARQSFINGHFVATVLLCQGLMEHMLASELESRVDPVELPARASASAIRQRSREAGLISEADERDLARLQALRNPLTHYRDANHPEHIDMKSMQERSSSTSLLERDAVFAITTAMRLLAKPPFRLGALV